MNESFQHNLNQDKIEYAEIIGKTSVSARYRRLSKLDKRRYLFSLR